MLEGKKPRLDISRSSVWNSQDLAHGSSGWPERARSGGDRVRKEKARGPTRKGGGKDGGTGFIMKSL